MPMRMNVRPNRLVVATTTEIIFKFTAQYVKEGNLLKEYFPMKIFRTRTSPYIVLT